MKRGKICSICLQDTTVRNKYYFENAWPVLLWLLFAMHAVSQTNKHYYFGAWLPVELRRAGQKGI